MPRCLWMVSVFLLALSFGAAQSAEQDGGMWTFDNLPIERLRAKYGFAPDQAWIDKVQRSAVRVSSGGSGSFVSAQGLVMTNHHVALELINKLSNAENDLVTNGFHARRLEDELVCPEATLSVLMGLTDVTAEVVAAGASADSPAAAGAARRAAIETIQERLGEAGGNTVEVVALYGGGQYIAHHYKVYTDVRLVFAPEMRVAYYGGDWDNFVYPRYCLDMAFLRAYEDGKPADTSSNHFRWSTQGAEEGELTFVAGHPGRTSRQWPLARKRHDRDGFNPAVVALLTGRDLALTRYMSRGDAERIEVLDEVFGIRNSMKAYQGMLNGLRDAEIWAELERMDAQFRKDAAGDEAVEKALGVFDETAKIRADVVHDVILCRLEGGLAGPAGAVAMMQRQARQGGQPGEAGMAAFEQANAAMGNLELETERLAGGFEAARLGLPAEHPLRQAIFQSDEETARAAAERIIAASIFAESRAEERSKLLNDGEALQKLACPLVNIARIVAERRGPAQRAWAEVTAKEEEASAVLAEARLRIYGKAQYPDATFTLRLTFGVGRRYELGTTIVPWITTFHGLYERHRALKGEVPFDLPQRWLDAKSKLNLDTPYDFVSTHDIIGGNSGSPVFNKDLEVVGLIFDGNIQSLPNNYLYLDKVCRAVSVHSAGMTHALQVVYEAKELLAELGVR